MDNILKRDIEQRYRVQYKAALETMAHHLLNTAPTIASDAAIRENFGLLLAARKTNCTKLLLLTDHEHADITEQGQRIAIRPVYEWALNDEEEQP